MLKTGQTRLFLNSRNLKNLGANITAMRNEQWCFSTRLPLKINGTFDFETRVDM